MGVMDRFHPITRGIFRRAGMADDTRREAHDAIKPKAGDLREKCLEALRDAMLTADEVAEKVGESVLSIRPRITELAQQKRIMRTPFKRKNSSGRMAAVWMLPA